MSIGILQTSLLNGNEHLLARLPLKLVIESKQSFKGSSTSCQHLHHKAVIETICRDADIPKEWYIISNVKQDITELSPLVPLDDIDSYMRLRSDSIKIKKSDSSTKFLIRDPASIVQFLADKQLNIFAVYTKDAGYVKRILEAKNRYQN